ncbi:MAG TPA: Wzz/FepE/Etk N-terminal domain-containing protein [Candidatus Sulfotelmatobacter sp.]|nr:Wzz/FepE/Etk N-terminal domain-containing protein [Candidatus Sulfotelmatobacter sp.]
MAVTRITAEPPDLDPQLRLPQDPGQFPATASESFFGKLRLLWDRRRTLATAGVVGLVCATLLAFLIPKRYESQARLMPPDSNSGGALAVMSALSSGAAGGGSFGALAGDLMGMKSTTGLFIGVLRSRTLEDAIIARFDLKQVYRIRFQDGARLRLEQNTEIVEDRKSGIITVTVTDTDPKRAAAIATAYVEELDSVIARVSTSSARRERIFLEERLAKVKQDLESAENSFSHFASKNGAIDIPAQGKAMVEAAARMEGELVAAQSQLEGLKQIFSDDNYRVKSTQARITELRRQLNQLSGPVGSAGGEQAAPVAESYPRLRQLPALGVPWADLFREVKIEEAVVEVLTKQYELAKVEEAKEIPTVKVLDVPQVPEHKSFPPRLLIMFIGTCLALGLTGIWILAAEHWYATAEHDPGKRLAQEIFQTTRSTIREGVRKVPWFSRNGSRAHAEEEDPQFRETGEPRN